MNRFVKGLLFGSQSERPLVQPAVRSIFEADPQDPLLETPTDPKPIERDAATAKPLAVAPESPQHTLQTSHSADVPESGGKSIRKQQESDLDIQVQPNLEPVAEPVIADVAAVSDDSQSSLMPTVQHIRLTDSEQMGARLSMKNRSEFEPIASPEARPLTPQTARQVAAMPMRAPIARDQATDSPDNPPPTPAVNVTIGRVIVTGGTEAKPITSLGEGKKRGVMTLQEYVDQRNGGPNV